MLRCQGFEVNYYDFTLGRLAHESLRAVQNSGRKIPTVTANAGCRLLGAKSCMGMSLHVSDI